MDRMKCFSMGLLAMVMVSLVFVQDADARRNGRRNSYAVSYTSSTGAHMTYTPTIFSTRKRLFKGKFSLQDIATMRAQWMAHYEVLSHEIHAYHENCPHWAGHGASGEGIGCSSDPNFQNCATCIVGSTVVADGWAKSKTGMIYRVRFFN
jgi:hypothetical protein